MTVAVGTAILDMLDHECPAKGTDPNPDTLSFSFLRQRREIQQL